MFKANCILNDIDDKQITLVEKALSNECSDKVVEKISLIREWPI